MAEVGANGVRHHVQVLGDGAPEVVFVHGLVMDNLSSWYFTAASPVAASGARSVLYDLRGHGRSERPETGYDPDTLVEDLAGVLDALEVDRPVQLVGNSFGGLLALAFARAHPERTASVLLVDALTPAEGWGAMMARTLGLTGDDRDALIADRFRDWLGRHSERKRNRLARTAEALVHGTSLVDDLAGAPPWEDADYERVEAPVLALYGADSDVRADGEAMCARLPRATLEILPGCSHSVLWEATGAVRDRIVEWVREQSR